MWRLTEGFYRNQNALQGEESLSNSSFVPERYSVNNQNMRNRLTIRNQMDPEFSEQSVNTHSNFSERYNVDGRYSSHRNQSGNSVNAQDMVEE